MYERADANERGCMRACMCVNVFFGSCTRVCVCVRVCMCAKICV